MLRGLIRAEAGLTNAIIFCNRKRDVATLARSLQRHGFSAGGLHGDMDQKSRMETLDAFKTDKLKLLIASDVAARGLDIPAVSHVINFDVPTHAEDYVHRIGRTGRAGRSGTSITLAAPSDGKYVDAIVKLIQRDIPLMKLDGAALDEPQAGDATEHREERPKRGRRRGAERRPDAERKPDAARTESAPHREHKPQAERPAKANGDVGRKPAPKPRDERPAARPPRERDSGGASSPFGSDGPVPAFLLRPGNVR
jgi:superfamily II DNA/RNA helicase